MYTNSTNTSVFFDPIHTHTHRLTGSPVWFKDIRCEDMSASHILRCQTTPASGGERHGINVCGSSNQRLLIKCGESYSTHPALLLTPQSFYMIMNLVPSRPELQAIYKMKSTVVYTNDAHTNHGEELM